MDFSDQRGRFSDSTPSNPSSSVSGATTPQAGRRTCEPCGASCQQMAESQCVNSSLKTAALSRRHSADGAVESRPESAFGQAAAISDHFRLCQRQFSDGAVAAEGCLQPCSSFFSCQQELCNTAREEMTPWNQYNDSFQSSYSDPSIFLSQSCPTDCLSTSLQQISSRLNSSSEQSSSSKCSVSSQSHQQSNTHFPKPIFSYSILIFMALKNSKTGSLPVSEIYSFMTEHFPYFKIAPDGWKNSVRHNLSLNKCFVKVENKNGNASRKGCLWALNLAKVEKMQDELHKWRRKDPVAIRRSMAWPECFDRLLGDKPDKLRFLPSYTSPALSTRASVHSTTMPSCTPVQLQPPCESIQLPPFSHIQPQECFYLPPVAAHSSNSFALCSPCEQPTATGSMNSPLAGKVPLVFNGALQADYSLGPRSMQDFLLEGDPSYDIDTLNPSLTDLQMQDSYWEEFKQDSHISDPQMSTATTSSSSALQGVQTCSLLFTAPPVGRRKAACEEANVDPGQGREQHGCFDRLYPLVYSGVESLAGCLTSRTTSISLM